MRILFTTDRIDAPSTVLNQKLFDTLNKTEGVKVDFFNRNYEDYDVVLFMGYDPKVEEAKTDNPKIKVGIVDIRPSSNYKPKNIDFIVANGIEMKDWYLKETPNIFIYPIYPFSSSDYLSFTNIKNYTLKVYFIIFKRKLDYKYWK